MSKELTEAKELIRQAEDKVSQHELLEEARERGFIKGISFISTEGNRMDNFNGKINVSTRIRDKGFLYSDQYGMTIYDAEKARWAEIILEKKEETHEDVFGRLPEKPLHDQIREGGWRLVMDNAGHEYVNIECCPSISIRDDHGNKILAYNKLLSLSKVLNEGKERGEYIFTIECDDKKLHLSKKYNSSVEIFTMQDATFALEFAEKEWKIFYNAK